MNNKVEYKTLTSTKTMNFANSKNQTRSYKMVNKNVSGSVCVVDVKVGGKVIGNVTCTNSNGALAVGTINHIIGTVKPIDITECKRIAALALKTTK